MCPKCKKEIGDVSDKFCRYCGADLTGLMERCKKCALMIHAHMIDGGVNYCPDCGSKWDG